MSYCRWSSDDYKCDLYCYEAEDGFVTHIAAHRLVGELPPIKDWIVDEYQKRTALFRAMCHEPIVLPHAGETFVDPDLESFLARLIWLRELGYRMPESLIPDMQAELEEERKKND